ncbi:alanine--tRNA ligase [Teladorsagia circumcincta]|uniref:Alanine--tRNA ligase n=1 Tax=Teladorsagia circumcincta TaxID=45464 RepID=A0A2G9TSI5_TELCI|nr:alanine--tRNA ligase [Teladorsagia circumcincta]
MGLERLASVMQNVPSNFDIDIFSPIMKHISVLSKSGAYSGRVGSADTNERDASYRIVADHLRGTVVALADGVVPSAVDSGFIIRKMLRRLFWHAVNRLGIDRFACSELVPVVIDTLTPAYPELAHCGENVSKCVMEEEDRYWNILDKGNTIFEQMRLNMPANESIFSGENAWILHDTHGIPIEITEDLTKKHGLVVDNERFVALKEEAKMLSKSKSNFSTRFSPDTTGLEDCSSDDAKYEYSLNADGSYLFPQIVTKVVAAFDKDQRVPSFSSSGSVVVENCQFYAEEGGQKCDRGVLEVNEERRLALMRAHSATHLLNWALRRVGAGRGQRGSAIDEDFLRFDYATDDCAGEDDTINNYQMKTE